jgi:hypothetical protein
LLSPAISPIDRGILLGGLDDLFGLLVGTTTPADFCGDKVAGWWLRINHFCKFFRSVFLSPWCCSSMLTLPLLGLGFFIGLATPADFRGQNIAGFPFL